MTDASVSIDGADRVVVAAGSPSPSAAPSITMPDHEVRSTRWFQLYVRLARPTHDWLVAFGVGWALLLGPMALRPLGDGYLVQVLLYAGATFGIRTLEKIKGVA